MGFLHSLNYNYSLGAFIYIFVYLQNYAVWIMDKLEGVCRLCAKDRAIPKANTRRKPVPKHELKDLILDVTGKFLIPNIIFIIFISYFYHNSGPNAGHI